MYIHMYIHVYMYTCIYGVYIVHTNVQCTYIQCIVGETLKERVREWVSELSLKFRRVITTYSQIILPIGRLGACLLIPRRGLSAVPTGLWSDYCTLHAIPSASLHALMTKPPRYELCGGWVRSHAEKETSYNNGLWQKEVQCWRHTRTSLSWPFHETWNRSRHTWMELD